MAILMISTFFFFFFLFLFLALQWLICNCNNYSSGHGPKTYPIIGCLISFYKNKHRLLHWYTELLSNSPTQTIVVRRLGARRTVVTANPDNVEHILKTNFPNYPKGQPFTDILGDLLGSGIFNADGELWHSQRKLASHEFTTRSLRDVVVTAVEREAEGRLLPVLASACADGRVVDMQDLLRRFAFDAICNVSLGADPGCLEPSLPESELARVFEVAAEISARRGAATVSAVWKAKRALGIGTERVLKDNVKIIHDSIVTLIRTRMEEHKEHGIEVLITSLKPIGDRQGSDFLSRLISAGHSVEVVRDMVISIIMAGRDTTSAALTWFFWLISRHPSIEQEVVKELVQFQNKDYHALKEMKFLEACLLETMRLYPPVSWDSKHAAAADTLPDGTAVEEGDRVTYFPYGMGRMEKLWGKSWAEFDPRRWLGRDGTTLVRVSPFKFPVFQAGPRVCLGKEMAMLQMKYVAAAVVRRFEVRPVVEEETPAFVPLLTAHMAGGLRVMVRERSSENSCMHA